MKITYAADPRTRQFIIVIPTGRDYLIAVSDLKQPRKFRGLVAVPYRQFVNGQAEIQLTYEEERDLLQAQLELMERNGQPIAAFIDRIYKDHIEHDELVKIYVDYARAMPEGRASRRKRAGTGK